MRETVTQTIHEIKDLLVCIQMVQQQMMTTLHLSLYLTLACSPGKAYVKGYEIEKITQTFKDINKSRDFQNVNAGVTTYEDW